MSNCHFDLSIWLPSNSSCQTSSQPARCHSGVGVGAGVLVGTGRMAAQDTLRTSVIDASDKKNVRLKNFVFTSTPFSESRTIFHVDHSTPIFLASMSASLSQFLRPPR